MRAAAPLRKTMPTCSTVAVKDRIKALEFYENGSVDLVDFGPKGVKRRFKRANFRGSKGPWEAKYPQLLQRVNRGMSMGNVAGSGDVAGSLTTDDYNYDLKLPEGWPRTDFGGDFTLIPLLDSMDPAGQMTKLEALMRYPSRQMGDSCTTHSLYRLLYLHDKLQTVPTLSVKAARAKLQKQKLPTPTNAVTAAVMSVMAAETMPPSAALAVKSVKTKSNTMAVDLWEQMIWFSTDRPTDPPVNFNDTLTWAQAQLNQQVGGAWCATTANWWFDVFAHVPVSTKRSEQYINVELITPVVDDAKARLQRDFDIDDGTVEKLSSQACSIQNVVALIEKHIDNGHAVGVAVQGHAMTVVGYSTDNFLLVGSWGDEDPWGLKNADNGMYYAHGFHGINKWYVGEKTRDMVYRPCFN